MNGRLTMLWAMVAGGLTVWGALLFSESGGAPPGGPLRTTAAAVPVTMPPAARARGARFEAQTPAQAREVIAFAQRASSDDVPALRAMALHTANPLVAGNALRALGRLGRVAGDPDLLALLDDSRPRVRQELVRALGRSGVETAVRPLANVLGGDDAALRPLALQALGRLGGAQARAILAGVRDDARTSSVERVFARQALADCADERG